MREICEPFPTVDRLICMRVQDPVSRAYRVTFGEYASKLEALHRLLESKPSDNLRLEKAMEEVEAAREAYHSAREVLASELGIEPLCAAAASIR